MLGFARRKMPLGRELYPKLPFSLGALEPEFKVDVVRKGLPLSLWGFFYYYNSLGGNFGWNLGINEGSDLKDFGLWLLGKFWQFWTYDLGWGMSHRITQLVFNEATPDVSAVFFMSPHSTENLDPPPSKRTKSLKIMKKKPTGNPEKSLKKKHYARN